eukprot:5185855-Pleurochrysis_carterae.AAC.2
MAARKLLDMIVTVQHYHESSCIGTRLREQCAKTKHIVLQHVSGLGHLKTSPVRSVALALVLPRKLGWLRRVGSVAHECGRACCSVLLAAAIVCARCTYCLAQGFSRLLSAML